jgi:hypothetical protein
MWERHLTLERIQPLAGRLLLGVFLLAAQLAPLAHLATHRPDHTHGPEPGHDHEAAPRAAHSYDHDHDDADHDHDGWFADDHGESSDHGHDGTAPADPTSSEHGRASAAHFDLALLAGPPPPFLPPPAETLAPPPDAVARWHHAPALPQPPARGPPHSH